MAEPRDAFSREVDEELRHEQLLKIWQQYGTYLIAAATLIIIGVGGYNFYEHRSALAAQAAGARFSVAVREGKPSEVPKSLEDIAKNGPVGYASLARLRVAAAYREAGKTAEALAAYEEMARDRRVDPMFADYARLQTAALKLDSESWTDIQNRLNPLAADSNAWRYSARELLGLAALKAGKPKEARVEFEKLLGDRNVPPSIAERSRVMMAMLTEQELAGQPSAPAAPAGAEPTKGATKAPEKTPSKTDAKTK